MPDVGSRVKAALIGNLLTGIAVGCVLVLFVLLSQPNAWNAKLHASATAQRKLLEDKVDRHNADVMKILRVIDAKETR